MNLNLKIAVIC